MISSCVFASCAYAARPQVSDHISHRTAHHPTHPVAAAHVNACGTAFGHFFFFFVFSDFS